MHACPRCGFPYVCNNCDGCLCPRTGLQEFLAGEDVDLEKLGSELRLEEGAFDVSWFDVEAPANHPPR